MEDKHDYSQEHKQLYDSHLDDSLSEHNHSTLPHLSLPLSCPNTLILDTLSSFFSPDYLTLSFDRVIMLLVQRKTLFTMLCQPCSTNVFHC